MITPYNSIPLVHTIYIDISFLKQQVAQLFGQSLIMLIITFLALAAAGQLLIYHVQRPIREFLKDVEPFANFDFDQPFRRVQLPELAGITDKMEDVRLKLAHYKRINVEQLILQAHRNQMLMNHSTEMAAQYDETGRFTFINEQLKELLHNLSLESRQVKVRDLLQHDHVRILEKKSEVTAKDPLVINSQKYEVEIQQSDEKFLYLQLSLSDITDRDGRHLGGMLLCNDRTKNKELEKVRTEMINLIIHEFQNPVNAGLGLTTHLIEDREITDSERYEILEMIKSTMEKQNRLIERFLEISKLESGNTKIGMVPVDLGSVIREASSAFRTSLAEKNIHLSMNLEEVPSVLGSRNLLEDVLYNLISNAIKYGGENRSIIINLWHEDQFVRFSVTDNGFGIPDEYLDKIFEKFFRIESYNKEKGTGLGLSYTREIVRKHSGEITVESNSTFGTRFTVSIPVNSKLTTMS